MSVQSCIFPWAGWNTAPPAPGEAPACWRSCTLCWGQCHMTPQEPRAGLQPSCYGTQDPPEMRENNGHTQGAVFKGICIS